jgi:hypothetical protein
MSKAIRKKRGEKKMSTPETTTTKDPAAVLAEHQAAMQEYAAAAQNPEATQAKLKELGDKVHALGDQFSAAISAGAEICAECQAAPMGMLKTPSYFNAGLEVPPVYEVGCVFCAPVLVPNEARGAALKIDGETRRVLRRSYSARANTPAEAVRKWNAGEYVEDTLVDRIPGFTPEYAEAPAEVPPPATEPPPA